MSGVEHSEVNIRSAGLTTAPSDINKDVISRATIKYQPVSINRTAGASATVPNVAGQVEFKFTTGSQQWLDLFNSHFLLNYNVAAGNAPGCFRKLMQNMIGQAYLYIGGKQICYSTNWSVASQINKRTQFSKQYNQSVNDVIYNSDYTIGDGVAIEALATAGGFNVIPNPPVADPGPGTGAGCNNALPPLTLRPQTTGIYTDKEYLDGFFIRDRDSCWLPPNCDIRMVLLIDREYIGKSTRNGAAANNSTLLVNTIDFVAQTVVRTSPIPTPYALKFITNNITSPVVGANCNQSLTVDPAITKLAIVFQDPAFATQTTVQKTAGGDVLSYATQNEKTDHSRTITGVAGAEQLTSLQVQLGSVVIPTQQYDFATNLSREAYEAYMFLTGKTLSFETQESFLDWLYQPIYLFDFPRTDLDKSTNLVIRAQRATAGVAAANPIMHIVEMDESGVELQFDPKLGAIINVEKI